MNIYIIPIGWDKELVIKTAFKSGADKICLIMPTQKKDHLYSEMDSITRKISKEIISELEKFVELDIIEVNYFSIKDIVSKIADYVNKNSENTFTINIATASRYFSVAIGMIAYAKNIKIEFSKATYNPKILKLIKNGEDLHAGFNGIESIPSMPFSISFSLKEKKILLLLKEKKKITVKDFIKNAKGNLENRLRSEFHYTCKKLEKQGIVLIKGKKSGCEVLLTDLGEVFVQDI